MIKNFFLQKNICRGIFMIAGLFVFLNAFTVAQAACTDSVDFNAALSSCGGFYSAPNLPNSYAFAALAADGSIFVWGNSDNGGSNAPSDTGYIQVYATSKAFAALKSDGSITVWGEGPYGGSDAPSGIGYTQIYSTERAFAALASDGSIEAWGNSSYGGSNAPSGIGYTQIYSTERAFAALASDGSIEAWGDSSYGGSNAPSGIGYTQIYSTKSAFAALASDGSIEVWGDSARGGTGGPFGTGYTQIYSTGYAFAALASDGSIEVWGDSSYGGSNAPSGIGYTQIYSNNYAFAILNANGSIEVWGNSSYGGSNAPSGTGYTQIYSTGYAFAALASDGSIEVWGHSDNGGSNAPSGTGYTQIYSNNYAFAALTIDGSIDAWGNSFGGSLTAPSDTGYTQIYSTAAAFAALKSDGSITAWGDAWSGGTGAPSGTGYTIPYGGSCSNNSSGGSSDITIPDPDTTDIQDAVINNHISVDNGTIDNTDQITTQTNITFTSNTASALFPTNTIITEQSNGNYNFQNFTIQDKSIQNTAAAIDLGIPGTDLSFSQDITLTLDVGDTYNDQTLNVYSQSTGQTDWTLHTTCTVSEGDCTFTTNHATIYTAGGIPGAMPIDINVEVQDTLTLDCFDTATGTGDLNVTLGTTTDPGKVTAGTPATGQSTCTVTTNDDQGYYLTLIDDNAATNTVLTHTDPHTGSIYEIQDLTQFPATTTWTTPTTKGLGFSVVTFPDTQTDNNTLDETWTNTSLCPEGNNPDTNTYAGIPDTAETISAVTQYESLSTTTNICYKVDVPASQASGQYTGSVTYTATSDASSYLN